MLGKMHKVYLLLSIVQTYALKDAGDDKCRALDENPLLRAGRVSTPKKVLIATPLKNAGHALHEFAEALQSLTYPKEHVSLAFLISDSVDNTAEVLSNLQRTTLRGFAQVKVFEQNFHYEAPEDRHAFAVQAARRGILAKSRNLLIEKALTDDTHSVLWLDVDITGYPRSLIQDLLAMGRPVVAPHVLIGPITYDKNSWRETRPEEAFKPGGPEVVFEGYPETALAGGERIYMDDLRDSALARGVEKNHQYAVSIDGVGTAVLLVEARVHREGVLFPEKPYKKRLESEGFGLWAKDRGFQPCGLPFYEVYHYDEWSEDLPVDARRLQNGTRPKPTQKPEGPVCKTWCKDHEANWKQKCSFKNCKGCKPCKQDGGSMSPPTPNRNTSKPMKMVCKGKAECKGKEMNICLRLEREGKCEWGPTDWVEGPGECDGPAECARKDQATCKRMEKCKWKVLKEADLVPGECVGKRGQPECDDKDKITCKQLQKEKKCKWLPAPSERKTPSGKCSGAPECIGKPRRTCHRMRMQEGKCRYKPAPENEVKVGMKLKNVNPCELNGDAKEKLKGAVADQIAKKVEVESYDVNVTLSATRKEDEKCLGRRLSEDAPGINVDATIDMEEQIGLMEAENEGKEVDLVSEMKAIKNEVQEDVGSAEAANEVLQAAVEVEGVKEAAAGEITISEPETEVTAEAATKAPEVITNAPSPSAPAPAPEPEPAPSPGTETGAEPGKKAEVDTSVHKNAFTSLVLGTVAVVPMQ
jgi:hypothetical protein